jgi:hypothetical protein
MTDLFRREKNMNEQELAELEALLQAALAPVPPRSAYRGELQHRLGNDAPSVEYPPARWSPAKGWTILGIAAGITLLVWSIKTLADVLSGPRPKQPAA